MIAAEMKSGMTVPSDAFLSLGAFAGLAESHAGEGVVRDRVLIYGGEEHQKRTAGTVLPWRGIAAYDWATDL